MKKKEFIEKYSEEMYKRMRKRNLEWKQKHQNKERSYSKEWRLAHPERIREANQESCRKGGKHYEKRLIYNTTGLRGDRSKVRRRDRHHLSKFKRFFAQESQIHHQWIPGTSEYTGTALVEKNQHIHGVIEVLIILNGEITLLTDPTVEKLI